MREKLSITIDKDLLNEHLFPLYHAMPYPNLSKVIEELIREGLESRKKKKKAK